MSDWASSPWRVLRDTPPTALRLAPTLLSGMSFRWRREESSGTFVGVLGSRIFELREDEEGGTISFRAMRPEVAEEDVKVEKEDGEDEAMLRLHLRLDDGVTPCSHAPWLNGPASSVTLARFRRNAAALPGVRVLRILDTLECLVTFLGSANNNIKRNMQMVRSLAAASALSSVSTTVASTERPVERSV